MRTEPRARRERGFSLLEVFLSITLLSIATLGLVGGIVVAQGGARLGAKRTVMTQFARARLERLITATRSSIPIASSAPPAFPVSFSPMAVGAPFDPNAPAAPQSGGWMLDLVDARGTSVCGGLAGDDLLCGPVLVDETADGDSHPAAAATLALRASVGGHYLDGSNQKGCADPAVAGDPSVFCREVHIESVTVQGARMLRAWVRVLQGGYDPAGPPPNALVLQEDVAQ